MVPGTQIPTPDKGMSGERSQAHKKKTCHGTRYPIAANKLIELHTETVKIHRQHMDTILHTSTYGNLGPNRNKSFRPEVRPSLAPPLPHIFPPPFLEPPPPPRPSFPLPLFPPPLDMPSMALCTTTNLTTSATRHEPSPHIPETCLLCH